MALIANILSKFDDSGIRKAKHSFGGLKSALGAIGIGYGLKQVADLLLESAKAASADAVSIKLMNSQLSRNAGATKASLTQNDKFIQSLSLQTGILDDDLRPIMSKFGNVTHNVGKAQKLLKIQLDVVAGSGKSSTKVANALAKAYGGNTKSLMSMFPELKNSKTAVADLAAEFSGAAVESADPFKKFNNSMDILKEKLGNAILPMIATFATELTKPGGIVEQVGKFFDSLSNPKTQVGQAFVNLKDSVVLLGQDIGALFALMDPKNENNSMNGFAASLKFIADSIGTVADAATVFAGIMAAIGKGDFNRAIELSAADIGLGAAAMRDNLSVADEMAKINAKTQKKGKGTVFVSPQEGVNDVIFGGGKSKSSIFGPQNVPDPKNPFPNTNVNIHVYSADPKAVVDAVSKYVKTNGNVPSSWNLVTGNH